MIEELVILNYKSAKEVKLTCKKLNLLIGGPNTGKSNILEALGLFSLYNNDCNIQELARFQTMHNLFYDNKVESPIHIRTDKHRMKIQAKENFEVYIEIKAKTAVKTYELFYDQTGKLLNANPHYVSPINLYKFRMSSEFKNKSSSHLRPPHGDNLVLMLLKNPELRKQAAQVFKDFGYRMMINPLDSSIQIQKESDGIIVSHPYTMASPIFQRFIFHLTAIRSNKDSVIIFEEPESYASTSITNKIAEEIAADESNQFFVSTHNPNFLMAMLDTLDHENVKIYYTYYENYQTKVKSLFEEDYKLIQKKGLNVFKEIERIMSARAE